MLALADVAIVVSDAKASAKWWKDNLGFASFTMGDSESGHAVLIAPPGDRFVLHLCEGFAPAESGNTGIAFMCDDIAGLVAGMEKKGVKFTEALVKNEWGGSAKFADPDGNVFWLVGAPAKMIRETMANRAPGGSAKKAAKKSAGKKPTKGSAPKKAAKKGAAKKAKPTKARR